MSESKGVRKMVAEANARITTLSVEQARGKLDDPDVQFVDIRDVRELERDGRIPGAFHAPRGMLEFWADPDTPYYKPVFGEDKLFLLYCRGGERSALAAAALQDVGIPRVCHMATGYTGWTEAGEPTETYERKKKT